MKKTILSVLLILGFVSVVNSDTNFVLQKNKTIGFIASNHILNSGGFESCEADCDADYDSYCYGGGYYDTQACEYLEDELYACYDDCYYNYYP